MNVKMFIGYMAFKKYFFTIAKFGLFGAILTILTAFSLVFLAVACSVLWPEALRYLNTLSNISFLVGLGVELGILSIGMVLLGLWARFFKKYYYLPPSIISSVKPLA